MPSDFVLKSTNTVHRTMLKVSGGRWGWSFGSMPVLELTTVGRRSGQKRSVTLKDKPMCPMVATVADADERARLWPKVVAEAKNYGGYQQKTDREIPVVLLTPKPA